MGQLSPLWHSVKQILTTFFPLDSQLFLYSPTPEPWPGNSLKERNQEIIVFNSSFPFLINHYLFLFCLISNILKTNISYIFCLYSVSYFKLGENLRLKSLSPHLSWKHKNNIIWKEQKHGSNIHKPCDLNPMKKIHTNIGRLYRKEWRGHLLKYILFKKITTLNKLQIQKIKWFLESFLMLREIGCVQC